MKKLFFIILFVSTLQYSFAAETKTYLRADYGLGKFKTDQFDSFNANPSGSTIGASFGSKMSYVELGVFFRQTSLKSKITHDSVANEIIHDGKTFGVEMNVFLNNHLSLKFGYAFHSYKEKLGTTVSAQTLTAIKSTYGFEEDFSSSNVFYGANIDIFGSKRFDIYTSVLHFPMGESKSSTTGQVGIRVYMDLSLSDFFGANY